MLSKKLLIWVGVASMCLLLSDSGISARGGGGGGGGGGGRGGGGGGYGGGGFRGGSVSYSGRGSGSYEGGGNRGGSYGGSTYRPGNYGSLQYGSSSNGVRAAGSVGGEREGSAGGGGAWVKGPAGGAAGAVVGPRGGVAAGARGPEGAAVGGYRTPYGASGAAVRGPAGNAAGVFHGPAGGTVAGVRGPYGAGVVAALPSGYGHANWHGHDYYHNGYNFYRPYWYGGAICYWPVNPPIGWFFNSLPAGYIEYGTGGNTYYYSNNVYYQSATQDGQQGYTVVDNPQGDQATADPSQPQFAAAAPDPFKTFQKMSEFLGKQDQFTMQLSDTFDEVSDAGPKIQMSSKRTVYVQRPDKAASDYSGDTDQRRVVYDGKTITAIDLTKNAYATIPMQGPLDGVLDKLAKDYGMSQPVDNLLYTDLYSRVYPKLEAGQYVGVDTIGDVKCDHLAFRQQGIDWEVWMQQGDAPVPRKVSITHTDLPSHPKYTLEVTQWKAGPVPASAFDVQLPKDAKKIEVLTMIGEVKGTPP